MTNTSTKQLVNRNPTYQDWLRRAKILVFVCAPWAIPSAPAFAQAARVAVQGEYILARNPFQNPVCQAFTRNLNQFRHLPFNQCSSRLSPKFPEFSRPPWNEIPFDPTLAEAMVKSRTRDPADPRREEDWQRYLARSEAVRKEGKARMWLAHADLDADRKNETLIRMVPNESGDLEKYPPYSCEYNASSFIAETAHKAVAQSFNFLPPAADIIRHDGDGRYYRVDWRSTPLLGSNPFIAHPDVGATAGLIVYPVSWYGSDGSEGISRAPDCVIDWVPTGHYRPIKPKRAH